MKKIDIKSALIGVFFTTTVIFSLGAATGPQDRRLKSPPWDARQKWQFTIRKIDPDNVALMEKGPIGWEFCHLGGSFSVWRKRID